MHLASPPCFVTTYAEGPHLVALPHSGGPHPQLGALLSVTLQPPQTLHLLLVSPGGAISLWAVLASSFAKGKFTTRSGEGQAVEISSSPVLAHRRLALQWQLHSVARRFGCNIPRRR